MRGFPRRPRGRRAVRGTLLTAAALAIGALAGCASPTWQFADNPVFAERTRPIDPQRVAMCPAGDALPIVRAQFTGDSGRSVPSLWDRGPTQPTASGFQAAGSTPQDDGLQPAPVSPAYGARPTLLGGAQGQAIDGSMSPPSPSGGNFGYGTFDDTSPVGNDPAAADPARFIPLNPMLQETQTGRLMLGVGVNSDSGLVGSIILDEQNFNWMRFPRGWQDIRNATAWRGRGQQFRLEAIPGTEYQRYTVDFMEPYLFYSEVGLGLGGHYYTRRYREWDESRGGGRISLIYHFNHALTGTLGYHGERVTLFNPVEPTPRMLTDALGDSALHGVEARLAHDTRDSRFLATEGHYIGLGVEQVVGTYQYPRIDLDLRKYFLIRQRPDGAGRHVLGLSAKMGWTDSETPIYEHYYAGGFSLRGFDFRGASPRDPATNVFVGGHFQLLATAEYLFPITADDMLRGVIFCDTGAVQPSIDDWRDKYRVSPGFGLRVAIPAMGPAPIALDFAFPIVHNPGDRIEIFSFFVGFLR